MCLARKKTLILKRLLAASIFIPFLNILHCSTVINQWNLVPAPPGSSSVYSILNWNVNTHFCVLTHAFLNGRDIDSWVNMSPILILQPIRTLQIVRRHGCLGDVSPSLFLGQQRRGVCVFFCLLGFVWALSSSYDPDWTESAVVDSGNVQLARIDKINPEIPINDIYTGGIEYLVK